MSRFAYGSLFMVALPVALIFWARRISEIVPLPEVDPHPSAWLVAVIGLLLVLSAFLALRLEGGGLPMNAFPPPQRAYGGPYLIVRDPIYLGFCMIVGGVSAALGSPGGCWIVTPAITLACITLVAGFERRDLERRTGPELERPLVTLPAAGAGDATWRDRLGVFLVVLVPWALLYELVAHLPVPGRIDIVQPFERQWPVLMWTTPFYSSAYLGTMFMLLAARTRPFLRTWALDALFGMTLGLLIIVVVPFVSPYRPFVYEGPFAWELAAERVGGVGERASFPSFHVFWVLMAARLSGERRPLFQVIVWIWAILVSVATVTTGMHGFIDVLAAGVLLGVALSRERLWRRALSLAERVANSWREWHRGPLRIINHGIYAGIAAFVGVIGVGMWAGAGNSLRIALVAMCSLIGAALWGQVWVGSRTLLRPFGYFGGVLGAAAGLIIISALGGAPWELAAACAVMAPWVQGIGRLRCLVQGCCHGAPVAERGIRYWHGRSRVCSISHLKGVEVHATPLYSICANLLLAAIMVRLWAVNAPASMVVGVYLMLAGMARFFEESLRGEVTTPVVAKLRLYQWFAIISVLAGAVVTGVRTDPVTGTCGLSVSTVAIAILVGLIHWVAMGVDVPASNRRFSRLV